MLETKRTGARRAAKSAQAGGFSVEFALVSIVFFMLIFGVIELARAMYVVNTLQEVTRRAANAAAQVNYRDETAKDAVRQNAVFRTTAGSLLLGEPVSDRHVRIDYLALVRAADGGMTLTPIAQADWPSCTARNRVTCMTNPNDPQCIRFVRVRICDPDDTAECRRVRYQTLASLIELPIDLPMSTTIATAESLGHQPGMTPCN
ncbi:MAG: TadE/TadG family type IV pilus assembly protein [Telluria sp.]